MSGKLVINKITNCEDVTITMENTTVVGNFGSLQVNDISDSRRTDIKMKGMKVMTEDEYRRRKTGSAARSHYGSGSGSSGGQLGINKITNCNDTTIHQENLDIKGRYDDLKLNEVERSGGTSISMKGLRINEETDSDESDEDDDSDEYDENGLPKPSTYAYYVAEKFTFTVRLGGGATVTCTFLKKDRVKTVKDFITEMQVTFKDKTFRLQEYGKERFMDDDPEATLEEAGFCDKIDLKAVLVQPNSRYYR